MIRFLTFICLATAVMAAAPAPSKGGGWSKTSVRRTSQAQQKKSATPKSNVAVPTRITGATSSYGGGGYHPTSTGHVVVVNNYHYGAGYRIWWAGGYYGPIWYGPGWFYPSLLEPGFWFWGLWGGYRYDIEPYNTKSGIKFDLSQISKADRKAVDNAGIWIPDNEGDRDAKLGYLGKVGNFSEKFQRALPLEPGTHEVTVAVADGRKFEVSVIVQPGRVTKIALSFDKPQTQPTVTTAPPSQALIPAPPPNQ